MLPPPRQCGVLLLFLAAVVAQGMAATTEVEIEYGRIKGDYEPEYKLTGYYGVPFASPPVGDLRLRPPVPPQAWNKTKDCTIDRFFHVCPQFHFSKKEYYGNEDCLYANIYVPEEADNQTLPVMFWIYGGGYSMGDGYEFGWYRGKHIAASRRVIVVEFNYRLGALGFLAHPDLKSEAGGTTGNYGVQDQVAALGFTNRNIAAFNGDPKSITIFGESAGAISVCWHLTNPSSQGLFSAAIMESGSCSTAEFFISQQRAYEFGQEQIKAAGCDPNAKDVLTCLRSLDAFKFFMKKDDWPTNTTRPPLAPVMPWGPTIDGSKLGTPARPIEMMRAGDFAHVPLIIGTNRDEGSLFMIAIPEIVPGVKLPMSDEDFYTVLQHFYNDSTATAITDRYPEANYKNNDDRMAHILRDFFFMCPSRAAAGVLASHNVSSYLYQFNMKLPNWVDYDALGNYHTSELSFVFDNQWPPLLHTFGEKEKRLAATFGLYWTNMAKHGDPNHDLTKDQAVWTPFSMATQPFMNMDVPTYLGNNLNSDTCDFWDVHYTKYYFQ